MPKKREVQKTRVPLKAGEKSVLFATLIRQPEAFEAAQSILSYEQIAEVDRMYAVVWQVVCDYYAENDRLPEEHYVQTGLSRFLAEDPDVLTDKEQTKLAAFLGFAFDTPVESLRPRMGERYLSKYMEDRLADEMRSRLTGYTPVNIYELFQDAVARTEDLTVVGSATLPDAFEDDWLEENEFLDLRDTGIDFINRFLGGDDEDEAELVGFGHGCTESFGLLGPYGGGKTTTGVMLSTMGAKLAYNAWEQSGGTGPLRLSYHFTWEEPKPSLRLRALAFLAEVPHKRIKLAVKQKDLQGVLSNSDTLLDYEQTRYAHKIRAGEAVGGEYERVRRAIELLNACWRVVDLTGSDKSLGLRGTNLVDEVAAVIRKDQRKVRHAHSDFPTGVQMVVADYVGAAAEKHLDANGMDHGSNLRHIINRWPLHMKTKVAVPFFCPVWSLHQLSTQANTLMAGSVPKYTDSAEGKAFAENLDFCVMYGMKDSDDRMVCTCNKARREAAMPPIIVRLRGAQQRVVDDSSNYTLKSRRITSRTLAETVQGGASPAAPTDDEGQSPNEIQRQNQDVRGRRARGARTI